MTSWEKAGLTLMLGAIFSECAYIIDPNPDIAKSTALMITLGVALVGYFVFMVCGNQNDET